MILLAMTLSLISTSENTNLTSGLNDDLKLTYSTALRFAKRLDLKVEDVPIEKRASDRIGTITYIALPPDYSVGVDLKNKRVVSCRDFSRASKGSGNRNRPDPVISSRDAAMESMVSLISKLDLPEDWVMRAFSYFPDGGFNSESEGYWGEVRAWMAMPKQEETPVRPFGPDSYGAYIRIDVHTGELIEYKISDQPKIARKGFKISKSEAINLAVATISEYKLVRSFEIHDEKTEKCYVIPRSEKLNPDTKFAPTAVPAYLVYYHTDTDKFEYSIAIDANSGLPIAGSLNWFFWTELDPVVPQT